VAIGPVSLPGYIDRAEVVFASGPNEFQIPTNALWAGSLRENISHAVAADLGRVLGSDEVRAGLESGSQSRYRVALDIRQFHGLADRKRFSILPGASKAARARKTISRHSGSFREPIIGDGYAPLVAAESRLLGQCAAAIAKSLR
jgi:uncharacterized lipoprotein YmbA